MTGDEEDEVGKGRTQYEVVEAEKGCFVVFREELSQALGGQEVLPNDWTTTANALSQTGRRVTWCVIWKECR